MPGPVERGDDDPQPMTDLANPEPVGGPLGAADSDARSPRLVAGLPRISKRGRPIRPPAPPGREGLPIEGGSRDLRRRTVEGRLKPGGEGCPGGEQRDCKEDESGALQGLAWTVYRSEERRVGKKCRS